MSDVAVIAIVVVAVAVGAFVFFRKSSRPRREGSAGGVVQRDKQL